MDKTIDNTDLNKFILAFKLQYEKVESDFIKWTSELWKILTEARNKLKPTQQWSSFLRETGINHWNAINTIKFYELHTKLESEGKLKQIGKIFSIWRVYEMMKLKDTDEQVVLLEWLGNKPSVKEVKTAVQEIKWENVLPNSIDNTELIEPTPELSDEDVIIVEDVKPDASSVVIPKLNIDDLSNDSFRIEDIKILAERISKQETGRIKYDKSISWLLCMFKWLELLQANLGNAKEISSTTKPLFDEIFDKISSLKKELD